MMESGDFQLANPELRDASVTEVVEKTEGVLTTPEDPSSVINPEDSEIMNQDQKRSFLDDGSSSGMEPLKKKPKSEGSETEETSAAVSVDREGDEGSEEKKASSDDEIAPIPPATVGISTYDDNDVLSGRGGGTNVHPGNRNFRDLINLHRRAYLKARKNDKPAISRAIVRAIRETNGKFLKKDEKSGLWFEIGDDAAREKTSQALRQRAPEMRKLLFDAELEEARMAAEQNQQQQQQQRMMMGIPAMPNGQMPMAPNVMFNHPFMTMTNKGGNGQYQGHEAFVQPMFSGAAMYAPNGMGRFHPNHPPPS